MRAGQARFLNEMAMFFIPTANTGTPQPSTPIFMRSVSAMAAMVRAVSRNTGVSVFQ